ncbi:hypothetical protein AB5I41_00440 [Sphingomonas sp. MMS24-JH45]
MIAQSGRIRVAGMTRPGLYLEGPVERLTAPGLMIDTDTRLDQRRAETRIKLKSDALSVDAGGILDFAIVVGDFAVDAQLLTPGAIAPNLNGRDVLARFVLDGPFKLPTVDYKVRAAALGFQQTVVQGLYAEGLARVNADRILVPSAPAPAASPGQPGARRAHHQCADRRRPRHRDAQHPVG